MALVLAVPAFRPGDEAVAAGVPSPFPEAPVSIAHRGASGAAPENTFAAFDRAVRNGADVLELDVRPSADGRAAVVHDRTVDRTTNGSGEVASLSMNELARLDAGHRFAPQRGYPYRGTGEKIPMLREVLARYPETPLNVEIKAGGPGFARTVARTILRSGAEDRVVVASRSHASVAAVRRASGGAVPTGASTREVVTFFAASRLGLSGLLQPEYGRLQLPATYRGIELVTPELVSAAGRAGVPVDAWTINSPKDMARLKEMGVAGVVTDRPGDFERF